MTEDDKKKKPKKVGYPFSKVDNPFYVKLDKKLPDLNKSFEERTARQQAEKFKKDSQEYIDNPLKHLQENPLSFNAKPLINMQEPSTPEVQREIKTNDLERGVADYKYVKPPEFTRSEEEQQSYNPIEDVKTLVTDAVDALKTINFWVGDSVNGVPTPKITATNYATAIPDLFRAGATLLAMPFNAGLEFVNSNPEARPITKLLMGIMESASYLPKLEYNYIMDLADKNSVTPLLKPFGIEDNRTVTDVLKEGADVIGIDEPQFNNLRKFVNEVIDFGSQTALFVGGSGLLKGLKKPEYYERMNVEGEPIRRKRTENVNIEDANYQDIPPEGQKQLPEYIEHIKTEDAGFAKPDKSKATDARYIDLPPDNVIDMGERMTENMIKTDMMMLNRDRNNMSLQIRDPNINPKERLGLIETRDRIDQKINELETKLIESKKPEIKNDQIVSTGKDEFIEKVKTEDAGFAKPDKNNISDAKFKDIPPDDFTGDPTTDLPDTKPPTTPTKPSGETVKLLPKAEIKQPAIKAPSHYTVVKEIPKNKLGKNRIENKKYPVITYDSPIFKHYVLPKRVMLSMAMPPEPPLSEAGFGNKNTALVPYKEKPTVKTELSVIKANPDESNAMKVAKSKKLEKLGVTDKWEQTAIDKGLISIQHAKQKNIKPKLDEVFKKAEDGYYSLSKEGNGLLPYMYNQAVAALRQHNPEAVIDKADILKKIDTPETKNRVMLTIKNSQQENIKQWVEYLKNQNDYNDAFKLALFNEILTKYYNYNKQKVIIRGNTTLTEIPPLHMGAVALTYAHFKHTKNKPLIQTYLDYVAEESKKDAERLKVKSNSGDGEWVKFPSKKNDPVNFESNVATLSGIAQNTNWCTKVSARSQLSNGDFYVYMTDNKTRPRLGVRLEDNIIAETAGILNEPHQGVEPEMEIVLEKFIDEQDLKYSSRVEEVRIKLKTSRMFRERLEGITDPAKKATEMQNIVKDILEAENTEKSKGEFRFNMVIPLSELPENLTLSAPKSKRPPEITFEKITVIPKNLTIEGFSRVSFPQADIIPKSLKVVGSHESKAYAYIIANKATKIEEGYKQEDYVSLYAPKLQVIPKEVSFQKNGNITITSGRIMRISEDVILPKDVIIRSELGTDSKFKLSKTIVDAVNRIPTINNLRLINFYDKKMEVKGMHFENILNGVISLNGVIIKDTPLALEQAHRLIIRDSNIALDIKGNADNVEIAWSTINGGDMLINRFDIKNTIINDNLTVSLKDDEYRDYDSTEIQNVYIQQGKKMKVLDDSGVSYLLGGKYAGETIPENYNTVELYPNPAENNKDYIQHSSLNNKGNVNIKLPIFLEGKYKSIATVGVSKTKFNNKGNVDFETDPTSKLRGTEIAEGISPIPYSARELIVDLSDVIFNNEGNVKVSDDFFLSVSSDNVMFNNAGDVRLDKITIKNKAGFNNEGEVYIKKLTGDNGTVKFGNKGEVWINRYEVENQKIIFENDGDVYIPNVSKKMKFRNSGKVYNIATKKEISLPLAENLKKKIVGKLSPVEKAKKELGKLPDKASALPFDFYAKQLNNLRIIGQDILERGFKKFVAWSKEFIKELGQAVKPFARKVWNEITNKKLFPDKDVNTGGVSMKGIKDVADKIKIEFKNYDFKELGESVISKFRSRGKMTSDIYEAYNRMKGKFNASREILEKDINSYKKIFEKEIKGKSKEEQRQIIEDGFKYLTDKDGRLRRKYDNKLSKDFMDALNKLRVNTDALSTKLAGLPYLSEELSGIIIGNLGEYMHRFYESDHNPKWKNYIMKTSEGQKLYAEAKERMIREYQEAINTTNNATLKKQYADALNNIDHYLLGMLEPSGGILSDLFAKKRKIGRADTGMLKRRGELPEEYRKLKGEIRDPVANYVRTIYKLTNYINAHKFLSELRAAEYNKSFFDKRTVTKDGDFTVLLAKGTDKQFTPLTHGKDIYTSKAIAESLQETFAPKEFGKIANMYFIASGLIKIGKTAYSPITIARNATSNVPLLLANGHTNFNQLRHSSKVVFSKDAKYLPERIDALKYGVIGESASGGELSATVKDAFHSVDDISNLLDNTTKRHIINIHNKVVKSYSGIDDVSKYTAWLSEQKRYKKAYEEELANKDMTEEDIKKITASIVSNTMPSYGRAVPIVRNLLRRLPLGNFVTFPAEIIRTSFNILQQAGKEIDNPKTRQIGKDRLKGLIGATIVSSTVLPMVFRLLSGVSNEEEDAARVFMPEYQRNSQFLWLNKNRYIDLSYEDPYNYLKRGIVSIITGISNKKKVGAIIADAVAEYLRPFTEAEIAAKVLTAMATGWDSEKQERIWLDSDTWGDRAMKMADFALDKSQPGVTALGQRLYKSFTDQGNEFKSYNPLEESLGITGLRVSTLDVPKSFYFASVRIKNAFKDIADRYHKDVKNDPESKVKIAETVKESLESQVEIARKYVESAKTLGLTDKQISEIMKKAGVPNRHMATILNDKPIDIESDRGEQIYGKPEEEGIPKQKKIEEQIDKDKGKTLNEKFKMLDKNKNRLNRDSLNNQLKGFRLDRGAIKEQLKKQSLSRDEIKKQLQLK